MTATTNSLPIANEAADMGNGLTIENIGTAFYVHYLAYRDGKYLGDFFNEFDLRDMLARRNIAVPACIAY